MTRLAATALERYTPLTQTGRAELAGLLRQIRQDGFALVDQELEIGLRSLGVPIRNRAGEAVAGLSVSLLEAQLSNEQILERYLEPLKQAALEVTRSLPA